MSDVGTLIGRPIERADGAVKTSGAARYTADQRIEGTPHLHAVLVKSPVAAGTIRSFDLGEARVVPGFLWFLSHEDGSLIEKIEAPDDGSFAPGDFLTPFADAEVRFVGQHVGVVIAETLEAAEEAAALVRVDVEERERHVSLDDDAEEERPEVYNTGEALQIARGDVEAGLRAADVVVDAAFTTPAEHHNPIEPSATLAVWHGDALTVYDATQGNVADRNYVATGMGSAPDKVRVLNPFIGGGFGCKGFNWAHSLVAAAAARVMDRPVLLTLSRKDMYTSCGHRPTTRQAVTLGATSAGRLTATRHVTRSYRSPVGQHMEPCGITTSMLYACENLEAPHIRKILNRPSGTPLRGPGEASGTFALESAMDELAEKLGLDPIELRRINHADTDQRNGRKWSSKNLLACYDQGAKRIGWDRRRAPGAWIDGNEFVGLGMATSCYPGYRMPGSARITLGADGKVEVATAIQDIGTGAYTIVAQMAADRLGCAMDDVTAVMGDTDLPPGPMAGGSMTTASISPVIADACAKLREKLRVVVTEHAPQLGNQVAALTVRGGKVRTVGDSSVDVAELFARAGIDSLDATGDGDITFGYAGGDEEEVSFYSFGAIFAEVRVDRDYGIVRIPKMTGVFDAGRIINARTARSQLIGGMTFGIGMALMEETEFDETGAILNPSLGEYYVPVNADVHELDVHFLDIPDHAFNPDGARGIGELGNVGAAAAIANAVHNATGVRVRDLPIRLDDLLQPRIREGEAA